MNKDFIKLGRYQHHKGGIYEVLGTAVHSETLEKTVIYQDVSDPSLVWARPLSMWNELVKAGDTAEARFCFIDDRPFLMRACAAGSFGEKHGCILDAGFIYLTGEADATLTDDFFKWWKDRMFVPSSESWENAIKGRMVSVKRYEMHIDMAKLNEHMLSAYVKDVTAEYKIVPFDEQIFAQKPYHHGANFASWDDFKQNASGFVALYDGKPVTSASSFLTRGSETELDVSTSKAHRRRNLALACCAAMLLDCRDRGLEVHWDAQNMPSRHLAEKLGYELGREYTAYCFVAPDTVWAEA